MSNDIDTLISRVADATRVANKAREVANAAEEARVEARRNLERVEGELHAAIYKRVEAEQDDACSP